ncbi:MAG: DUF2012 domain-containing protein [Anaerolineae bacterium]|nr:DUF2012 domain-containing protein [Anaerolineae bacterium]
MQIRRTLPILMVLVLVVSGCNGAPTPQVTLSPLSSGQSVSMIPTPTLSTPFVLPLPSEGLSVIGGVFVDLQTQRAPLEGVLYLGEMLSLDTGLPVVSLDQKTAFYAIPAENGEFVFQDVPPGSYGLILVSPDYSFLIDDPKGEGSLLLIVEAGETLNLGRLEVLTP